MSSPYDSEDFPPNFLTQEEFEDAQRASKITIKDLFCEGCRLPVDPANSLMRFKTYVFHLEKKCLKKFEALFLK